MIADNFPPSRDDALRKLQDFVPNAGRTYAANRNYDLGAGAHRYVSTLSPYIRHRLIDEVEVLRAVLRRHAPSSAEKFIQEVCWRTYWKGWLERRPQVWRGYCEALEILYAAQSDRPDYVRAISGDTGIACFDAWVGELRATGYLHNHARMWFASIWIFTLRLPWELGADFFLRHLLDADAASNTLSWRWVAGLQTVGKTYQARADNIAKYTNDRFTPAPDELAAHAEPLSGLPVPSAGPLPDMREPSRNEPIFLLVHEDDLLSDLSMADELDVRGVAIAHASGARGPATTGSGPREFTRLALEDTARRLETMTGLKPRILDLSSDAFDWTGWLSEVDSAQIVTPYIPIGPFKDALEKVMLSASGDMRYLQRSWDQSAWPHATKGFFPFKKNIPELLATEVNGQMGLFESA